MPFPPLSCFLVLLFKHSGYLYDRVYGNFTLIKHVVKGFSAISLVFVAIIIGLLSVLYGRTSERTGDLKLISWCFLVSLFFVVRWSNAAASARDTSGVTLRKFLFGHPK